MANEEITKYAKFWVQLRTDDIVSGVFEALHV